MGWGLWPAALGPLAGTQAFLWVSMAGKLWPGGRVLPAIPRLTPGWLGLTSRSVGGQAGLVILEPRPPWSTRYMCFHSLRLQGSDLPSKTTTSTFFFCILINTEEAGAVKLYFGGKPQKWFIWCRGTSSYCFQYTISNQLFCILVFSFHFDKHCNYSY